MNEIVSGLIETGELMLVLCLLVAVPMCIPRSRRVVMAVMAFAKRYAPKWLIPVMGVCAFIPGPLDELIVVAAVMFPVLRSARNRRVFGRYVSYAWNVQP